MDKIKVKVSSFVLDILENDAIRFGFVKNENPIETLFLISLYRL